jgi:hypothetical protein
MGGSTATARSTGARRSPAWSTRASGRLAPQEALQLITIGQFCRHASRLPRSSHELLDRSLQLLLADKLADAPLPAGRRIDITRDPEPHDSISGQFDYSSARIEALIRSGRAATLAALAVQAAFGQRAAASRWAGARRRAGRRSVGRRRPAAQPPRA